MSRNSTTAWKALLFVAVALAAGYVSGAGLLGQMPNPNPEKDADFRFRPDHERQELRGKKSSYRLWEDQEGVPVYTGASQNLYKIELKPWKRLGPGVTGAYVDLEGAGALVNAIVWEIAPGAQTKPERHLFEEQLLVLTGEAGETHLWQSDPAKKVVIPWKRGTVFSPPINTHHLFINKGKTPARIVAVTDLPLKIDIFRSADFIYNTNYNFTDRYNGQSDYFDPENSKDYSNNNSHALSVVNLIRDAWGWRLFHAGQGYGDIDRHFLLSDNTMTGHIEGWPVGAYERAHKHGPSSTIVHLGGHGYTLLWPANIGTNRPWQDGKADKVQRVDWEEGIILIPDIQWYHQHFATGPEHAKFIKLGSTPGNERYKVTTNVLQGGEDTQISFADEDPYVRELFEKELQKTGKKIIMPSREELIKLEKQEKSGRMPATNQQ
jgi:quercetin dioxygenase-like cupin family protein